MSRLKSNKAQQNPILKSEKKIRHNQQDS